MADSTVRTMLRALRDPGMRRGLRVLGVAIRDEPRMFALAISGSTLFGAMVVGSAFVVGAVTGDVVVPAVDSGRIVLAGIVAAALALFGVSVLKIVAILGRRLGAGSMQFRLQADYRRQVTRRYLDLPLSWHQRHPTGALLSNANSDVEATWFPIAPFPLAVGTLVMLAIAMVALFLTDAVLALVGVMLFPAVLTVNVIYSRRMSPRVTRAQELRAEISALAHESFDGALVVKTLGRESQEAERFGAKAGELRDALVAVGRVRGVFDPIMEALPTLGTLAVLTIGAWRVSSGATTVADVVSVAFLFTVLAFPIRAIGWVLGELPRSVVGWDRVQSVLTATGSMPYGEGRLTGSGPAELALCDVRFAYPDVDGDAAGEDNAVLRGIDLRLPAGCTVALVGPTGSGKSTLASLATRLIDPDSGSVRVDDTDVRELAAGESAAAIALVPQTTFIFDDTVRDNVTLGADVTDEQVWEALRLAQADRFVAALADSTGATAAGATASGATASGTTASGLDARVGERGASLSGGQRQRLALARALVRKPRMLVLDDATSSVDPAVEAAILRGLRTQVGTTVLVVAYRRATIALADEVAFLSDGRIEARGTHPELLATVPGYARLVTAYERAERERLAQRAAERESDEAAEVPA